MKVAHRSKRGLGFVVCISNQGYSASLEVRKLYPVIGDPAAEAEGLIRITDESGEDYLYPSGYFRSIPIPAEIQQELRAAS